jgi:hypothetical protein
MCGWVGEERNKLGEVNKNDDGVIKNLKALETIFIYLLLLTIKHHKLVLFNKL